MLIANLCRRLCYATRVTILRCRGLQLAAGPHVIESGIHARLGFNAKRGRIIVGSRNRWDHGVIIDAYGGSVETGNHVYLGPYTVIYGHGGVSIGDGCLIAAHCRILSSNHTIPALGTDIRSQPDMLRPTKIGRDVWLGAGVTVLGGVTIGDGCVVGAGSVVTRDLPPGAIAYGSPAEVCRFRADSPRP